MGNEGDINLWKQRVLFPKKTTHEVHNKQECCYRKWYGVITATREKVILLIRICKCNKYKNKEEMLDRRIIYFNEVIDGVEGHVTEDCDYAYKKLPDETHKHDAICYCSKELLQTV